MTLHQSIRRQFGLPLIGIDADTAGKGEGVFRAGRVQWVRDEGRHVAGSQASRWTRAVVAAPAGDPAGMGGSAAGTSRPGVSGRVEAATRSQWQLQAAVTGSHGESYRTSVALARRDDTLLASSTCTCPVTAQCKHAAAALLAWLAQENGDDEAGAEAGDLSAGTDGHAWVSGSDRMPRSGANGVVTAGLKSVNGLPAAASQRSRALFQRQHALHWARELATVKRAGPGDAARFHLYYVLHIQDRAAQLSVFRIRRLKDGSFAPPDRYPAFAEHALSPPAFWDDIDASVALAVLQETKASAAGFSLTGPRAGESLLALARAGRLFLDQPPHGAGQAALAPGPDLRARVAWLAQPEAVEDDEETPVRLGIEVLSGPATPIYCAAPCYLDREAATVGALVLEQPLWTSMMPWLRNAPPVPPEAAAEVAIALHSTLRARPPLQEQVPELPAYRVRESKQPPRFVLGLFTTGSAPLPRNRQGAAPGSRPFMAISLAVEYSGQRVEPLRLSTIGVQTDDGPVLVVCDRPAEQAALAQLRDSITDIARDESGLSLASEARLSRFVARDVGDRVPKSRERRLLGGRSQITSIGPSSVCTPIVASRNGSTRCPTYSTASEIAMKERLPGAWPCRFRGSGADPVVNNPSTNRGGCFDSRTGCAGSSGTCSCNGGRVRNTACSAIATSAAASGGTGGALRSHCIIEADAGCSSCSTPTVPASRST